MTQKYFITARDFSGIQQRFLSQDAFLDFCQTLREKIEKGEKIRLAKSIEELHLAEIKEPKEYHYLIITSVDDDRNIGIYSPGLPRYIPKEIVVDFKKWAAEHGWVQFEIPKKITSYDLGKNGCEFVRSALRNEAFSEYWKYLGTDANTYQKLNHIQYQWLFDYLEREGPYLQLKQVVQFGTKEAKNDA